MFTHSCSLEGTDHEIFAPIFMILTHLGYSNAEAFSHVVSNMLYLNLQSLFPPFTVQFCFWAKNFGVC